MMMLLLLFLFAQQPPDTLVVNRVTEIAAYEPILNNRGVFDIRGVVIVRMGNKIYHKGEWGYPYEVVIVGLGASWRTYVWDTVYFFYMKDGEWYYYNDETLEDEVYRRHDT